MATTDWTHQRLEQLRQTRVWRSIFRRGPARTNRTRSLAVFGNLALHMMPVKVREKSLSVRATYYLGSISFFLFVVLTITGVAADVLLPSRRPRRLPRHERFDLRGVEWSLSPQSSPPGGPGDGVGGVLAHVPCVLPRWVQASARVQLGDWGGLVARHAFPELHRLFASLDQLAFWAITVGTNIISYVPMLGRPIRFLLLGGHIIGQNALLRFYVLHCVILPLAAVGLIGMHFWRIQKDGGLTVRDDHEREK